MPGSTYSFDICSDGNLEEALAIAFSSHHTATHWAEEEIDGRKRLLLAWHGKDEEAKWRPFPSPLTSETVKPVVTEWLKSQKQFWEAGQQWSDVSYHRGFRLYNRGDGFSGWSYAFVAIEPYYEEYHK